MMARHECLKLLWAASHIHCCWDRIEKNLIFKVWHKGLLEHLKLVSLGALRVPWCLTCKENEGLPYSMKSWRHTQLFTLSHTWTGAYAAERASPVHAPRTSPSVWALAEAETRAEAWRMTPWFFGGHLGALLLWLELGADCCTEAGLGQACFLVGDAQDDRGPRESKQSEVIHIF